VTRREAGRPALSNADNEAEFVAFVQASTARLFRLAYLLTGDQHRAEDLTQDALARTYGAWRRVVREDAHSYARRILVNLHTDWWRVGRWREQSADEPVEPAPAPDPAAGVVRRDSVTRALRTLTRRERAVVVLRYYADLSEVDIAHELNISVGTVKSTAARALRKLRVAKDIAEPGEHDTDDMATRSNTVEGVL
jgi:RNA polymerase sigma-70 factor (sigma-E family)